MHVWNPSTRSGTQSHPSLVQLAPAPSIIHTLSGNRVQCCWSPHDPTFANLEGIQTWILQLPRNLPAGHHTSLTCLDVSGYILSQITHLVHVHVSSLTPCPETCQVNTRSQKLCLEDRTMVHLKYPVEVPRVLVRLRLAVQPSLPNHSTCIASIST